MIRCPSHVDRSGRNFQCALEEGHSGNHYSDGCSWPLLFSSPQVAAVPERPKACNAELLPGVRCGRDLGHDGNHRGHLPPPAGRKDDGGKARWDLVPFEALELVVEVLGRDAARYGEWAWTAVPRAEDQLFAAAMSHLAAWRRTDTTDPETKLPRLAHAVSRLLVLLALEVDGNETAIARAIAQVDSQAKKETP